jgi:hypothetical protein
MAGVRLIFALVAAVALLAGGCEFGTNPLILDGSVATAKFPVDAEIPAFLPPAFSVSDSVDLGGIYDDIAGVDSVKFYNLTFAAGGDSAGLSIRVTGSITVNGVPFLNFDDVPLSVFSPERSIFTYAPGFSYDPRGVGVIRAALAPGSTVQKLRMAGDFRADSRSLHFSMQARLYTQVFVGTRD